MTLRTTYLETKDRSEFFEVRERDNHLRIRFGWTGRPCVGLNVSFTTPGKGQVAYNQLVQKWCASGFTERSPSAPVLDGSWADETYCDEQPASPLLESFFSINGARALRGAPRRLALFRSGLRWSGDFDFERLARLGLYDGVIIAGDMEVSGVLSQLSPTYPARILVDGNVRAASFGHGSSHMRVTGDIHVDNIIYGEYNDGSLRIDGAAYGHAWISSDHDMFAEGGHYLPVCDWDTGDNWSDCLHPDLFETHDAAACEGMVSEVSIRAFMREGRNPFRPGACPSAPNY
jgi:hypothetical protein